MPGRSLVFPYLKKSKKTEMVVPAAHLKDFSLGGGEKRRRRRRKGHRFFSSRKIRKRKVDLYIQHTTTIEIGRWFDCAVPSWPLLLSNHWGTTRLAPLESKNPSQRPFFFCRSGGVCLWASPFPITGRCQWGQSWTECRRWSFGVCIYFSSAGCRSSFFFSTRPVSGRLRSSWGSVIGK